jgi:hypothetical protein
MRNIVDKHSQDYEKRFFEKGLGDTAKRLIFPYRLGTERQRYVKSVVDTVSRKVQTTKSVEVNLIFVKGIPTGYAQTTRDLVVEGIAEKVNAEDTFIDMHVYTNISIGVIRQLEGKATKREREVNP